MKITKNIDWLTKEHITLWRWIQKTGKKGITEDALSEKSNKASRWDGMYHEQLWELVDHGALICGFPEGCVDELSEPLVYRTVPLGRIPVWLRRRLQQRT